MNICILQNEYHIVERFPHTYIPSDTLILGEFVVLNYLRKVWRIVIGWKTKMLI